MEKRRRGNADGKLDLLTWTALHRRLLAPGRPFDLRGHPYLAEIYGQTARRMLVYKAAQMGASEYLVSYALWSADQRLATALYVFPTDRHVSDFSSERIGPAIEASPYLSSIVVEGAAAGGKRGADRVTLKRVRDRFVYLRGGQVDPKGMAPQLKSIAADVLILDEWDEMDPRAPIIARHRLGHSPIAEERACSTPTYTGHGIHAEWLESDRREWHVRCTHCGEWQTMTIDQVVTEWDQLGRPLRWHGDRDGRAWVACRRCGRELDRLTAGRWVAMQPGRETVGYHLTKLFSPMTHLDELVKRLNTVDETQRREAFNQDLGEPYTPRGGQMTDQVLDDCRREYAHGAQVLTIDGARIQEPTWMGVDVGAVLHVVIRGPMDPLNGERPQRWVGAVDWPELPMLMARFNVVACVIDALPETTMARQFQLGRWGRVWLAYYTDQSKEADPWRWDWEKGVVHIDRTRSLDVTMSRFYDRKATLPAGARDIRDYYEHMKAQVRVLEDKPNGARVAKYVESGPDHLSHAENYECVAEHAPELPVDEIVVDEERVEISPY